MKTKIFSLVLFLMFGWTVTAFAQQAQKKSGTPTKEVAASYEMLWKTIAQQEKASLPESAGATVEKIYQKALRERNSPQLLKSMIYTIKYQLIKDKDLFPDKLKEIEKYTAETTNIAEQSMLYSIIAQLYLQYYQSDYNIDRRTAITGSIPEDIKEWTGNIFIQKITETIFLSLKNETILQQTDILTYKDILSEGKASRKLRPTLYDFLLTEGISTLSNLRYQAEPFFKQTSFQDNQFLVDAKQFVKLPVKADAYDLSMQAILLYARLLKFRMKENNPEALLMADLDRIEFVYNNSNYDQRGEEYIKALSILEKEHENKLYCVEILYKMASFYAYQNRPYAIPEEEEEFRKQIDNDKKTAFEICRRGIERYSDYERINLLKNLMNGITQPFANITVNNTTYPGKDLEMKIQYQNTPQLTIEIYRISAPVTEYRNNWSMNGLYKTKGKLVEKKTVQLHIPAPYITSDTLIRIPMETMGCYEYVVYQDKKETIANQAFSVSRLATLARSNNGTNEVLVADGISGKPVENAEIRMYKISGEILKFINSVKTGKDGLASIASASSDRNDYYQVISGDDTGLFYSDINNYTYSQPRLADERLNLFTDRSIYRPGQTVYFKGIATQINPNKQEVVKAARYTLSLNDANGKQIAEKSFTTNDFGSFSGEFILPQNGLGGNFSITTDKNSTYCTFKVEEYKRPTFDIQWDTIAGTYNFGDQIKVTGNVKTFSGINLQNAEVKYRITQNPLWIFFRYGTPPRQIAEGSVNTNDDGTFDLSFLAEKPSADKTGKDSYYSYNVEVTVTDNNGETQKSSTNIAIGDKSMYLTISDFDKVDKDKPVSISIQASNLNGKNIPRKGTYQIFQLNANETLEKELEEKDWKQGKQIASGNFSTEELINLAVLSQTPSGKYRIILLSEDDKGREISKNQDFILFSNNDKKPPVVTYQWFIPVKTVCAVGENAELIYGSSAKEVYVLYEIFKNNELIERSRFIINNETKKISIPFKEEYEAGVIAQFTFIKDGKSFFQDVEIRKKQPDKNLSLKMEVFRDKLVPGQKEEWKISIKDADKKAVATELLASMYDASLDKLNAHGWNFKPTYDILFPRKNFNDGHGMDSNQSSIYPNVEMKEVPGFAFDSFNWFGIDFYSQTLRGYMSMAPAPRVLSGKMDGIQMSANKAVMKAEGAMESDMALTDTVHWAAAAAAGKEEAVQIRTNFNETAFFYPQLRTNEAGETLIAFSVPESNTTWKFMALAHTQDLKYGQLMEKAISQKQLMITPNMPRFMRHGDRTSISTNISNLSGKAQSGKVSILFFDPQTEKPVITVEYNTQLFLVEAGKTTTVSWSFTVPATIDMAACKIIAQSEDFSDGEQHLLPVLPNRMLVTESLPLDISGSETKQFRMDKLAGNTSKTLENYRLTLEFAGNPTWYAVQALPSMTTPDSENAISQFASFYANNLAVSIANSTPKIKQIIDLWTKQGGSKETLISSLEKNQELKAVLLEETPWVLEAQNETEQKQRLSLLFDINRNNNLSSAAIDKLSKLQTEDGGWTWFKGMYPSPSITQWILYGFGQLDAMDALQKNEEVANMQQRAVDYIDRKFRENYDQMKKYDKNWQKKETISGYELEYLYVRSFYQDVPSGESQTAVTFFSNILEKYWAKNTNLYQRALAAIVMQRSGKKTVADNIVESLRQHAVKKAGSGMYWANNNTYAFFFQSATSIHTFLMQAFDETGASAEEMDLMKLWLLKQKQTQQWESTPATANAIYVLLKTGNNWLESTGEVDIKLGNKPVGMAAKEAGTGYIKQVYPAAEITPDMGTVSISKKDAGPAWGALYWQYFEDLDKITQAKTGLNVEKKLFVEKVSKTNKMLEPVTAGSPMHIGDKVIVRLTVRNDRDMEYVLLKDMRGACFEPAEQISGTKWKESVVYYQTSKDASTNFYFYNLPKGTYVFEYPLYVNREGEYSNGVTTIQCLYAPEFISHTKGERVITLNK